VTSDVDRRSQSPVGCSRGEAGVVHDVNETGVVARVRVHEAGKVAADLCKADVSHARVSDPEGQVRILRF